MITERTLFNISILAVTAFLAMYIINLLIMGKKIERMRNMDKEQLLNHLIKNKDKFIKSYGKNERLLAEENWRCMYAGIDEGLMTAFDLAWHYDFLF